MARKKKIVENSAVEVESAIKNEMDIIGSGEIPNDVKESEKEDE